MLYCSPRASSNTTTTNFTPRTSLLFDASLDYFDSTINDRFSRFS